MSVPLALDLTRPPDGELQRLTLALLDDACRSLGGAANSTEARFEAQLVSVHDARKRLKEARALLRLADARRQRERMTHIRVVLRDTGRFLSGARDAEAAAETVRKLEKRFQLTAPEVELLLRTAAAGHGDGDAGRSLVTLTRLRNAIATDPLAASFDSIERGLRWNERRCRIAMRRARERRQPADFHEWRKREKEHWYHARMLGGFLTFLAIREPALRRLSHVLGDQHDLVVLRERCAARLGHSTDPDSMAVVIRLLALARELQVELERHALDLGASLVTDA